MEWMLIYLNNLCECNILTRFILLLRKYNSFPGCQKQQFLVFSFLFIFFFFFSPIGNSSKVKYQKFGFSSHQNAVIYLSLLSQLCLFPTRNQEVFLPIFHLSGKLSVTGSLANWIWVPQCFISLWSFTSIREQHCSPTQTAAAAEIPDPWQWISPCPWVPLLLGCLLIVSH